MPEIRHQQATGPSNIVTIEESVRVLERTSTIRESEKNRLRLQIENLEMQIRDLSQEYSDFLLINDFVDPEVDSKSFISHAPISEFYEEEALDATKYIDISNLLINNPMVPSLINAQTETDQMLGRVSSEIRWYQNEINKKTSLKKALMKRLFDIDFREPSPES